MTKPTGTLAEIIAAAERARDRADKAINRYVRGGRISGEDLSAINGAMASLRLHLQEAATLTKVN